MKPILNELAAGCQPGLELPWLSLRITACCLQLGQQAGRQAPFGPRLAGMPGSSTSSAAACLTSALSMRRAARSLAATGAAAGSAASPSGLLDSLVASRLHELCVLSRLQLAPSGIVSRLFRAGMPGSGGPPQRSTNAWARAAGTMTWPPWATAWHRRAALQTCVMFG